jgi:hypothetical protein
VSGPQDRLQFHPENHPGKGQDGQRIQGQGPDPAQVIPRPQDQE